MSKPYTIVQVKRTTKDLDSTEIKSIIPRAGEWVLEYKEGNLTTNNTEELVIGNGHNDIEHLPRLKVNALSKMQFASSLQTDPQKNYGATYIEVIPSGVGTFYPTVTATAGSTDVDTKTKAPAASNRFSITLDNVLGDTLSIGDGTHKGKLALKDGAGYSVNIVPQEGNNDTAFYLPVVNAGLATIATVNGNIGSASATTPTTSDNSTRVATTAFVNNFMNNFKTSADGLKSGSVSTVGTGAPTSSSPANKSTGSLYVDNSTGVMYYYDGSAWQPIVGVWG